MREIKFRGWNKARKVMVYENEDRSSDFWDGIEASPVELVNWGLEAERCGYEFMQWTGLTDKNGKEIYEGDIVVKEGYLYFDNGEPNYRASVEWVGAGLCAVLHCINPKKAGISDGIVEPIEDGEEDEFEVIGNIYENPELLEKS